MWSKRARVAATELHGRMSSTPRDLEEAGLNAAGVPNSRAQHEIWRW